MKILLSPAKKMRQDPDTLPAASLPLFLPEAEKVLSRLQSLSFLELHSLWGCSEALARQNFDRLASMELHKNLTPAIVAYEGIAFQYMAPTVFEEKQLAYVQEHLRILSGLYGMLRPLDGVSPYRLEMQAPLSVEGSADLYAFWGRKLYDNIRDEDGLLINLASKEYFRCIEPYLTHSDTCITCVFGETVKGKLMQKATFAKMARGEMVRFLAENQLEKPEGMKDFARLGFHFRPDLSTDTIYTFERIPEKKGQTD